MIDILRPQTSSRGSSSKNNAYIREHPYVAPQRYGVGQVASPAAPQEDNPDNGGFLATELPPRPLDVEGCCNNGGQLAVTSIQSPGDVHEIQELSNSAEVGALCVAVVRQSLKQASREISNTTRGGAAVAMPNKQLFGAQTGVSSVEAFLVLLRRYAQAFAPRGNKGEQEYPDACLVLYCKLAGGVIMATPLEGPTFRLRQQRLPVVEDEEAPAREATETQQLTSWTLPAEGFEALLHLEKSVVPGLPALARDMANDKIMAATIGRGLTPLAEELCGQLYDGDENETQRVVVPRVAGIIFASLGRAAASTTAPTRGGTSVGGGGASLRVRAVLARLEQDGGAVARRFVLEDFDVFGDGGAGEGSRRKGRRSKGRTKRVPLPTTYASLLEEANSPCPSPGPSIATRILKRWRPGHKYRAGQNQVVPGVGEVTVLEKDHQKEASVGAGQSARLEKEATASGEINKNGASADTAMFAGKVEHSSSSSSSSQSKILGGGLLSVGDVMSASSSQVVFWASTQDVIRATLAAACRPRGNSCSTPGTRQSTTEPAGASCADARRAACALLARAFGDVPAGEEETGQETPCIGGKEASAALDRWYAELCSVTAPSFGGRGGVEIGDGSSLLLQEEGPRLLLAEMLEIPALQAAFARRGLARHLADALRVGSPKMKHREVRTARRHACARRVPDGEEPSRGTSKILDSDPDVSCACAGKPRANVGPRQLCCGADEKPTLPWWLLFSQGRREGGGVGHGHEHEHEHSSFSDTLKSLGGSADGVGAEADGRSCQTALDEIFAPERGKEERGAETSREDDGDDPNDGNSLGSAKAGGVPVFATAKQREDREWEVVADGGTVGGGVRSTTKAGRVAPPMLRLDALESILDTEEGASGRACSSHAVATLSAASTRAASEHLPSFLSARGATSRGSARHGSGRSTRTGRTTQRDSTASTGCPTTVRSTSPSAALVDLEVAAAPHPPLSPPPSSRYNGGGEPVPCCEHREGGAVATMMGPWPEPDDEASVGGATAPSQSAAKARGGNTECIVADAGGGLRQHPGGGRTVEAALSALPARQGDGGGGGGGGGSGREGMPRLQLGGLPAEEARRVAKTMGSGGGGSITGGSSPPASITTGQGYLNESAALRQPSEAGENLASWASPETGHESVARLHPGQTVGRASLQSTDGSSAGYVRRSGKGASPSGDVSGALGRRLDDAQPGDEELRCTARITPTTLLLNLARASAPGPASCSSPSQHSQPGSLSSAFGAETAAATLLVSLLPSTPVEHRPQESLLVALDVLSFVGALSWIDEAEGCAAATSTAVSHGGKRVKDTDPISSHPSDAPEYHLRAPGPAGVCPPGLANLDLALLANTAVGHLDLRLSALESLFEAVWHDDDGDEEMSPDKQKRRVHCACRLVLECTWLTRLLLRSVATAGTLNETLWSPLTAEATADAVRFCARALGMLQCCMRYTLSRSYFGVASSSRAAVDDEGTPEESPEVSLGHGRCCAAEMLLLTSPIAADLAVLLAALVRQPMAWGEDPAWAARTLGSAAFLCDGRDAAVIPALVGLLGHLVAEAPRKEGDHRQRVTSEGNQLQRSPRAHRSLPEASEALEKGLTGGRAALDHLLVAVLDSIAAVLRRAKILIETSEDASQGVRGSAAGPTAESARADRTQEETREAVSRVARGTALLFQPGGPVLTILEAQSPPTPLHLDGPLLCGDASPDTGLGSTLHIPCMAAALRLSTVFLSLRGTAGIRDEMAELSRPEDFVGPLFLGFRARWGGFVEGGSPDDAVPAFPPPPTEPGHRVGCEGRHEHEPPRQADGDTPIRPKSERERRSTVASSLCRLNLEALVELTAATRDPAVLRRLDDCRVAPFLLGRVLTVGGGGGGAAEGRRQDPLGSRKSAAQGSEEDQLSLANGPGMTDPVPHRIQQGKASHGGGGRDDTPEQAKPPASAAASAGRVSHAAAPFSVGDRVDGRVSVKGGRPRWFPGRVERVSGEDGTVHVCYDDGDEEPNKDPGEVRPSRRRPTERARRRLSSGVGQHSGGKQTPASAAPPPASAATVARQGGKQRPGTDDVTLKPGLSPAADGAASSVDGPRPRPSETAGEAHSSCRDGITDKCEAAEVTTPRGGVEGAGQPPGTVEVSAATAVSEGADRDPEPALSSAGGGGNSAENDSEDDDTYFVIPSVLVGAAAAAAATRSTNTDAWSLPAVDPSSSSSYCPVSVVPRIDLQSPMFRTRVFSSQLGPGSSLSTPTTGGGGVLVLDMLRGGGGSRSEASPCTPPFPSHRSSQAPRPPSFISRLRRGSGAKTRSASVLSDSDPSPAANPAGGLERQTTRERETSSSEEEEEKETEEEDGLGSSTSEAVPRCPIQQVSRGADETETGQGNAVAATTTPGVLAGAEGTLSGEKLDHLGDDDSRAAAAIARRQSDDLRVILGLAVTLLLSMAATSSNAASLGLGSHSSPSVPLVEGPGEKQENAHVERVMTVLQEFFEDDRNADIVPSLRVRWRSRVVSIAESAPAVLAKLVCAALFDSQSYPLDGDHVSAGRFGGIVVSECPLRLGGARRHRSSVQARGGTSPMGRRGDGESSATLPPLASSSPRGSQAAADDDIDEVALKIVERDELDSGIGAKVFAEVLALRTLADVPGVCGLYDFGVTTASYILVIERCVGSLKEWRLARSAGDESGAGEDGEIASVGGPRSDEEAALYLLVFRQIVSTVAAMAERGVIHLDLKCENILVRRSSNAGTAPLTGPLVPPAVQDGGSCAEHDVVPSVCVADFGESVIGRQSTIGRRRRRRRWRRQRTAGADASDSSRENTASDPTTDGDFIFDVGASRGTERIQSPEMVLLSGGGGRRGGRLAHLGPGSAGGAREESNETAGRITPASDVWSLGCLLYELLSTQLLFGDLHWSEFFVTLTAGGAVIGPTGENGMVAPTPTPPPPLPPSRSLRPFAALGCAEALRKLLVAMLVRDPAKRPSASQAVRHVDEALAAVTSSISKRRAPDSAGSKLSMTTPVGERRPTPARTGDEPTSASSHTQGAGAYGNVARRRANSGGNDERTVGTETLAPGAASSRRAEHDRPSNEGKSKLAVTTTLASTTVSVSLRPCVAVAAHRALDAERSALRGCDGCLHRLGAGAFILTGPTGGSGRSSKNSTSAVRSKRKGDQTRTSKNPDQVLSAGPQVGPETQVWCSAADCCFDLSFGGGEDPGTEEEAGASGGTALGSVLPSLGITHVVCVTSRRAAAATADGRRCSSAATKQKNVSREPQPPVSQLPEGPRFLRVSVLPERDNAEEQEEGHRRPNARLSGPQSMAAVVRDVMEFAAGPRVLFVGGDDDGYDGSRGCDVAGALALVWAMARTGKGSYETMLEFRQRCAGFFVDAAVLRSVLG